MVRLKPIDKFGTEENYKTKSQFHYGSIKTKNLIHQIIDDLKLSQFHYGSIKTLSKASSNLDTIFLSQFHYGSIKTYFNYLNELIDKESLNSTMVRLKRKYPRIWIKFENKSQFHYGSIKTLIK